MSRSIATEPSVPGSITRWNAERKFGFARTANHNKVFVHASSLCPHFPEARSLAMDALAIDVFGRELSIQKGPIQSGTNVSLLVERSDQGPRAWVAMCSICDSRRDLLEVVLLASERLHRLFGQGHAFVADRRRWFYSTRLSPEARKPEVQVFEAAALRAIRRGESDARVVLLAESAVHHFSDLNEQNKNEL